MTREEAVAMFGEKHVAICEKFVQPPADDTLEGRMYNAACWLMMKAGSAASSLQDQEVAQSDALTRQRRRMIDVCLTGVQHLYPASELDALIERDEGLYGSSRQWREWINL